MVIVAGIIIIFVLEGSLCRRFELPDPCNAPGDPHWSFDLVFDQACGFIDEGRSEGRVFRESECAAAHCGLVGELPWLE